MNRMPAINLPRLCLVTPPLADAASFAPALEAALAAGDVASLILNLAGRDPAADQQAAALLVPIAQRLGAAVLVRNDTRLAGRSGADGVHIDTGLAELRAAIHLRPQKIVGAAGATSRHEAMALGEADPDYLFFGRLDGDTAAATHSWSLELAGWWASLFEIPAILMAGNDIASVAEAAAAGVEFVALRNAIWQHPDGPAAAIAEAGRLMAGVPA